MQWNMINVYLCEDEEMQLDFIRSMLETGIAERKIDAKIISARKSPRDTLLDAKSRRNEKSLFVIDIQLNDFSMNGIDLARELKEISDEFHFVFLTSEWTLAYKTFEYQLGVLDYIVKDPSMFMHVLNIRLKQNIIQINKFNKRNCIRKTGVI